MTCESGCGCGLTRAEAMARAVREAGGVPAFMPIAVAVAPLDEGRDAEPSPLEEDNSPSLIARRFPWILMGAVWAAIGVGLMLMKR